MSSLDTAFETRVTSERPTDAIEGRPILVLNPAHGNEPYILATAIGQEVSKQFVEAGLEQPLLVMPLLYGDRQKRIVCEEFSETDSIYYDAVFGKQLQGIVFQGGDYISHISKVNGNYDDVERAVNHRYRPDGEPITVHNVGSDEPVVLNPSNVIGAIDTGNRIAVEAPKRYFAFPELLSRVLTEAMKHSQELGFSETDMTRLATRMDRIESSYAKIFIPWVSTFSYQYADNLDAQPENIDGRQRIYTPPMKADIAATKGRIDPGIYMMFSGHAQWH